MEEASQSKAGRGLGTIGLLFGVLAFLIVIITKNAASTITALIIGSIGVLLSSIGLSYAQRYHASRTFPQIALAMSLFSIIFTFFSASFTGKKASNNNELIVDEEFQGEDEIELKKSGDDREYERILEDLEKVKIKPEIDAAPNHASQDIHTPFEQPEKKDPAVTIEFNDSSDQNEKP